MEIDKKNLAGQVRDYLNLPNVILGNRLYGSANHLANIEMFVFARLGLTWEQVLLYNPSFNSKASEDTYNEFVTFVNEESELYESIRRQLINLVKTLDKVRDTSDGRCDFKRIENIPSSKPPLSQIPHHPSGNIP